MGLMTMNDTRKSKAQLIDELQSLRARVASLEADSRAANATERELKRDEQRQRMTIENAPVLFDLIDTSGVIRLWNRECERVTGYQADEIVGNPDAMDMLYPDQTYRENMFTEWRRRGNDFRDWEWELTCKNGERKTISWSVVSVEFSGLDPVLLNVGVDVTERHRAEENLRMLQAVVDRAADGIICQKADGRIFYANDAATNILGYSREELLTHSVFDFDNAHGREAMQDIAEHVKKSGSYTLTSTVQGRNNRTIPVELTINYIAHAGEYIYFLFFRDITRRAKTQQALRDSEERFRNTFEQAAVGIAHNTPDGRFIRINSRLCSILGYSRTELLTKTIKQIVHQDDYDEDIENVKRLLDDEIKRYSMELRHLRKDGSSGWVNLTVSLVRDNKGAPQYYISVVEDITHRKRAEVTLRTERDFVKRLMKASPVGIVVVDNDGMISYANQQASEILGQKDLIEGKHSYIDPAWHITDLDGNPFPVSQLPFNVVRQTGRPVNDVQHAIHWPDGQRVLVSINAAPLYDANHDFSGMVAIIEDITHRKHTELQLQASLHEKEILLQEIHHRVKNNLQLVSSMLSLQAETVSNTNVLQVLQDSQTRIRTMALIHEALYNANDLASINAPVYFCDLANFIFRTYHEQSQQVRLTTDIDPASFTIDIAIPCGLIINELLSNALKHAFPNGGGGDIHLSLRAESEETARLSVRDTGIGLPSSVDPDRPESLGLQLIMTLAGQIGASVEISREHGTAFVLTFTHHTMSKE